MRAERKIDYDRGVIINTHPAGMDVFMYVDTPGVYLNAHGTEVKEVLAREAGFQVDAFARDRLRRERMAKAMEAINLELETLGPTREIVADNEGFKVIHIGLGRHRVEDPEGNTLTDQDLTKEQAELLLDKLVA